MLIAMATLFQKDGISSHTIVQLILIQPFSPQLNPWRWQEKDSKSQYFTPFGGGKRLCPGRELARLEISVFLHHLVTRYSWEPVEKDRPLIFPRVRMMKGYPVVVRKLRKSDYE
ncbi:hypothetical protein O6H91_02G082200 [Diphasiastrum complanatum]|uniref:Uncharacterized protein n=1 Tax=Diphasiastrum complanatum TaxID=34168 RepID=A0ACC2EHQ1_DIPCM|nr:hypothetical protein O6H91_02G082200 [Diphasiastrum complanatum]